MCHFWKRMSQSSLLPVGSAKYWPTHWSVVNTCCHWWRYWRLRELQESCSKALGPTWREQDRVHHGQPRTLDWQGEDAHTCCTCCAELSHQNNLNDTTSGELPASHEPHPCFGVQVEEDTVIFMVGSIHSAFFSTNHNILPSATNGLFHQRYFKQHSSRRLWKEQLKSLMYDGQLEQVMGESYIVCMACLFI